MADANAMLMTGGGVGCQFPKVGHSFTGTVLSWGEPFQQTNAETKEPLFFNDGTTPRMQFPITFATDARGKFDEDGNPEDIADDDGVRTLYVKNRTQKAIRDAIRKAGGTGLEKGALLTITRIKPVALKNKKMYDYSAVWVPAAQNGANSHLMDEADPFNDED
jgi:hypothetical protein